MQTSYLSYEDLAKVMPPFHLHAKGTRTAKSTKAWQVIFNNEDSRLINGRAETNKSEVGSRRQMNLDVSTNPDLFRKVGPSLNMLAYSCEHMAVSFSKQLAHDEDGR